MRSKHISLILVYLVCVTPWGFGKENAAAAVHSLIQRADEISDIWSGGPVRLRMRVKFFAVKAGTLEAEYERVSASPDRWRSRFASEEFNRTTIVREGKVWQSSNTAETPIRVWEFERSLAALYQSVQGEKVEYSIIQRKLDDKKQPCAMIRAGHRSIQDCFDSSTGKLLSTQENRKTYIYADYQSFEGHSFPRTIEIWQDFTLVAAARVTDLERIPPPDASVFEAQPGGEEYPACREGLGLPLGAKGGNLVKDVPPDSPGLPSNSGIISNDQTVDGIVGRDGRVRNIWVGGLNPVTKKAALEAVQQWRFEPFTVCGFPVEMPIGLTMNFGNRGNYIGHMGP